MTPVTDFERGVMYGHYRGLKDAMNGTLHGVETAITHYEVVHATELLDCAAEYDHIGKDRKNDDHHV